MHKAAEELYAIGLSAVLLLKVELSAGEMSVLDLREVELSQGGVG